MGQHPKHSFNIQIPVVIALLLALALLSVVPIFFLQGLISQSAQETVEGEVLRLTQGIFNNARLVLNNYINDLIILNREEDERLPLLVDLMRSADGQSIRLPHYFSRRLDSLGVILLVPLKPGQAIRAINLEAEGVKGDWEKALLVRHLPAQVDYGSDTLAILRENPGRNLWLGHLPFLREMAEGFWSLSQVSLPNGEQAVLCMSLKQSLIDNFLRQIAVDTNANIHLICSDNTVLPADDFDFFNQPFASQAMNRANEGRFNFFRSHLIQDKENIDVLVHVYADPQFLYNIVATTPRAALTASLKQAINQTRWIITSVGLGLMLVGAFIVWAVGRRTAAIRHLLRQIADQDFNFPEARPLFSLREVEQLHDGIVATGRQLQGVLHTLEENQQNLESMVAKRTADLETALAEQIKLQDFIVQNEKMASLGRTVAGFTHELNTPLGVSNTASSQLEAIIGNLRQNFEANTLSTRLFKESIDRLSEAAGLINRNLQEAIRISASFKHVASDQSHVLTRDYVLQDYLAEVISSLSPKLRFHSIKVQAGEAITMHGDPAPFYQILANLINNSVDHGFKNRQHGTIEIKIDRDNSDSNQIVLHYKDDGHGMNGEQLARMYEPYFTTGQDYGGTGLGMGIVKELVEKKLGGRIECLSSPERGVAFTLRFPQSGGDQ